MKTKGRKAMAKAVAKVLWWHDYPAELSADEATKWLDGFIEARDAMLKKLGYSHAVCKAVRDLRAEGKSQKARGEA